MMQSTPAERNAVPILMVLERAFPEHGTVLEIASGTGQHVVKFAAALPGLTWWPSDIDPAALEAILSRVREAALDNIEPPRYLDVENPSSWPLDNVDAVLCINMMHISPWSATVALFNGAGRVLRGGGVLASYGPYKRGGRHTAPSNAAFDASLRARNASWGVRDIDDVVATARSAGFTLRELVEMPANNFMLVFEHAAIP
jgi:SAM-dependent methyltransferase